MPLADAKKIAAEAKAALGMNFSLDTVERYGGRSRTAGFPHGSRAGEIADAVRYAGENALDEVDDATYQAMEALIHNLDTMSSRAGAQVPFSSLNYGTCISKRADGHPQPTAFATEAEPWRRRAADFPCRFSRSKEGVNYNESDPNYGLFKLPCGFPPSVFPEFQLSRRAVQSSLLLEGTMTARWRIWAAMPASWATLRPGPRSDLRRGNLSFTSINLPRIALEARGDIETFYRDHGDRIDLVMGSFCTASGSSAAKEGL